MILTSWTSLVIDAASNVVLTIADHLSWVESVSHQLTLQEKLNRYLAFVESGETLRTHPDAKGNRVIFRVVTQHDPDPGGTEFLERARTVIETAGLDFSVSASERGRPKQTQRPVRTLRDALLPAYPHVKIDL
jgi:hypothetical protein